MTFLSDEQVELGLTTPLLVYNSESGRREQTMLEDCTTWQLLNVDIDEACDLVENVITLMTQVSRVQADRFSELVEREGVMSLGLFNFHKKHCIEDAPVYTAPANNHYSWSKAGTLLGLGSDALTPIQLDVNFRQDVGHLREKLTDFLRKEIPVISVTAVMGSTEESAVDPIAEIYDLREEFRAKGLNFAILADGAWGGYFKTMLIDVPEPDKIPQNRKLSIATKRKFDGFVPYCELSPYVQRQYEHIQFADTITIDPHKSGFCPYPGGALCYRNGKMRYQIALCQPVVFHGEDDPSMGVYGVEGSKPGAAPAGILMSHNIIGLSNRGYGRILGQCTATAKLFYAMWLTVAKEDDPFVCVPLQDIPEGYDKESSRKLVEEKIAFKSMAEMYQDRDAVKFLKLCGPDTMINTFVVNFRGNNSVQVANKLQSALFDAMNIFVGTNAHRVPLMLMQSSLDAKKHGRGLEIFKERAGLCTDGTDMNVMINTCMNPWQESESISTIGDLFRKTVLNCIGRVKDSVVNHRFILAGSFADKAEDGSIFIEYLTGTDVDEHQYQVSVKVEPQSYADETTLRNYVNFCGMEKIPVVFETVTPRYNEGDENVPNLYNILHLQNWDQKVWVKLVNDEDDNIISLKVLDIPRYQRLDMSATVTYPEKQKYFIYGDSTRTIIAHVMTKLPDFQHTATLSNRPHSLTNTMLEIGVMSDVEGVEGVPLEIAGEIRQPLQGNCYEVSFIGELHATIHTSISIKDTVFFNAISPNGACVPVKLSTEKNILKGHTF